jgi:hypothetical protein
VPGVAALGDLAAVAFAGAGLVVLFDAVISARVRAGSDAALRLSVLYPYLGVGGAYVLARALGLAALCLAAIGVALGLEVGRGAAGRAGTDRVVRVHRLLGLAVLALVAAHATVPYLDVDPPYGGWPTALVPFGQPSFWGLRASALETGGILAFYLLLAVGPSWYLLPRRAALWRALHLATLAVYALAVLHALFLGSDFATAGAARVTLIAAQVPICVLLARRLAAGRGHAAGSWSRAALALALVLAAGVAAVAIAGIAGASLGGVQV